MFVFSAMVEFAFVIYLKQMQAWRNTVRKDGPDRRNSDKLCSFEIDGVSTSFPNVEPGTRKIEGVKVTDDQGSNTVTFWNSKCALLDSLHLTNKIDLAGFVLFCMCYMIYNAVYWARVD